MNKPLPRLILGMSSGTSADAVDLALVRISGVGQSRDIEVVAASEVEFDLRLQRQTLDFLDCYNQPLRHLDRQLAIFFAACANNFLAEHGIEKQALSCIASHGQTVFHHDGNPLQGSLQLGCPQTIADETGCQVVADFRQADLRQGGQGAPISVFADWVLHSKPDKATAILNLGGIANISLLIPGQDPMAWDCGPANGPLDAVVRKKNAQTCDLGGEIASKGSVNQYLCQKLVQHPYFSLALPKSTGLEEFGPQWVNSIISSSPDISTEDLLATLCSVIAYGVSSSLQSTDVTPQEIYLCGGGRHNLALRSALVEAMPFAEILDYSQLGYDPDLREAVAFAILGDAFLLGETSTWPTTTGARKSSILGNLVRPRP